MQKVFSDRTSKPSSIYRGIVDLFTIVPIATIAPSIIAAALSALAANAYLGIIWGAVVGVVVVLLIQNSVVWLYSRIYEFVRGYSIESVSYSYEIDLKDHKQHRQRTEFILKRKRQGVRIFENRYYWTGAGDEGVPSVISAGHKLQGPVRRDSQWMHYFIYIGEGRRGEEVRVSIEQELYDEKGTFNSTLSKTVRERVNEAVELRASVPSRLIDSNVARLNVWQRDEPGAKLVHSDSAEPDEVIGDISWRIECPRLRRRYEIVWALR